MQKSQHHHRVFSQELAVAQKALFVLSGFVNFFTWIDARIASGKDSRCRLIGATANHDVRRIGVGFLLALRALRNPTYSRFAGMTMCWHSLRRQESRGCPTS